MSSSNWTMIVGFWSTGRRKEVLRMLSAMEISFLFWRSSASICARIASCCGYRPTTSDCYNFCIQLIGYYHMPFTATRDNSSSKPTASTPPLPTADEGLPSLVKAGP
jgi:hypothetical protein